MSRSFSIAVFAITIAFLGLFLLWPIFEAVRGAFIGSGGEWTGEYVFEVFRNPVYLEGLGNAFALAVASTVLTMLLALPLAWISSRYAFPGREVMGAVVLVPMILPPFVGAIGVKAILGPCGALNAALLQFGLTDGRIDFLGEGRFWGIVIMNALHLYPILYLNVLASLSRIDPAMEEAAENFGCTGLRRFFKISLPLIMPGVFAGGSIVFIWAFTELGVPLMFDFTRVTPVQIFSGIKDLGANPFPFALVTVMLGATVLFYATSKLCFGRAAGAIDSRAVQAGSLKKTRTAGSIICLSAFVGVTLLAILPHLGVVLVAFSTDWYNSFLPGSFTLDHFEAALGHQLTLPSIRNSLKYASLATLLDLALGVSIAYVSVRTRLPGRHFLDALAMLPLAVPGLVLAFGYLAMTQEGKFFAALNPTTDPLMLLVIAYAVRRLPYVVRSAAAGFHQASTTLEEAARNLGCSPLRALRKITLPLISPHLMAGALLAFSFAMLEVSDSLILAQRQQDYPITKAIYELYQLLGQGKFLASALGVWAMAFLAVTIIGTSILLGKRFGTIFRV